jgi:hypothetical protein
MANYGFTGRDQNQKGCIGTKLIGAAKNADLQDKAREDLGLTPRKVTRRICLKCDVAFVSRTEQRRCNPCREWAQDNWEMI